MDIFGHRFELAGWSIFIICNFHLLADTARATCIRRVVLAPQLDQGETMKRRNRGFTLVELLVVIAIIGVLVALLLPAVQAAREAGRRAQCVSNMKQLGLAMHNYHDVHGALPPGRWGGVGGKVWSQNGPLLPYMEQQNIYDNVNFSVLWSDPPNVAALAMTVKILLCPSDPTASGPPGWAATNYQGNEGNHPTNQTGVFCHASSTPSMRFADMVDGLSQTAAFSERLKGDWSNSIVTVRSDIFRPGGSPTTADAAMAACRAMNPTNLSFQFGSNGGAPFLAGTADNFTGYFHVSPPNDPSCHFPPGSQARTAGSAHRGGVNLLKCDGSVSFVPNTVDLRIWRAYGSRADGDIAYE